MEGEYKGGMDELLNDTVEKLNVMEMECFVEIRKHFLQAMDNAFYLFGSNAFRKANYVNKALFLGVSRVLCDVTPQRLQEKSKEEIAGQMQQQISDNEGFGGGLDSLVVKGADGGRVLGGGQVVLQGRRSVQNDHLQPFWCMAHRHRKARPHDQGPCGRLSR